MALYTFCLRMYKSLLNNLFLVGLFCLACKISPGLFAEISLGLSDNPKTPESGKLGKSRTAWGRESWIWSCAWGAEEEITKVTPPSSQLESVLINNLRAVQQNLAELVLAHPGNRTDALRLARFHLFADDPLGAERILRALGPVDERDAQHPLLSAEAAFGLADYQQADYALNLAFQRISQRLPLQVSAPLFCRRINGYRLYEKREDLSLRAGSEVLLYVEVANVAFRSVGKSGMACDIGVAIQILDNNDVEVYRSDDHGEWKETYQGAVRDMHLAIHVRIPGQLLPGNYRLRVICRDRIRQVEGIGEIAFSLANQNRTAAAEGSSVRAPAGVGSESTLSNSAIPKTRSRSPSDDDFDNDDDESDNKSSFERPLRLSDDNKTITW